MQVGFMQTGEKRDRKIFGHAAKILYELENYRTVIENKYFRKTQKTECNRADCGASDCFCWCEKTSPRLCCVLFHVRNDKRSFVGLI